MRCPRCDSEISEAGLTSIQPIECPSCGYSIPRANSTLDNGMSLFKNYFFDLWQILTHPVLFFRRMPVTGGIGRPLAFALVTHWLGTALEFLWKTGTALSIWEMVEDHVSFLGSLGRHFFLWFFGVGPVIIDPFLTLGSIFFTSFLVYLGARILVSPAKQGHLTEITFESVVRIISFGMTPAILAAIPFVGGFISSLMILGVTVIGAKEVYRIKTSRALLVVLFPKLLFLGTIMMGLFFCMIIFFKFFSNFI